MYHHKPSDDWDKKERKMDEADMKSADDEPEKEEVKVETETEDQQFPLSGLFCIYCHDYAVHIYKGNSICHQCFNKEMTELIKKNGGS